MNILIPLGTGSKWDNNELRYMLRSLEQNLKGEYEIYLMCTEIPDWVTNVVAVHIQRLYPEWLLKENKGEKHYEQYFDTLNKVWTFCQYREGKFLYAYDDILLMKPIEIDNIRNIPLEKYNEKPVTQAQKWTKHDRTILSAIAISMAYNNEVYNYETHIPRIYESGSVKKLIESNPFWKLKVPYSLATLYFNSFTDIEHIFEKPQPIEQLKAGFCFEEGIACYNSTTTEEIEQAAEGKTWVNYNDKALHCRNGLGQKPLLEWIEKQFPNKSKYEI